MSEVATETADTRYRTLWDYKTVVLSGGFMGRHSDELHRDQPSRPAGPARGRRLAGIEPERAVPNL